MLLQRLKNTLGTVLGLNHLNGDFKKFALMHLVFNAFSNIQSIFVNTLFYRLSNNSDTVMYYNMINFCGIALFMTAAVYIIRRISPLVAVRIGISLFIAMFAVMLATINDIVRFMPIIGILSGAGGGFYWLSYCMLLGCYTTDETRDKAVGLLSVISGSMSLLMPAAAGYVISRFVSMTGYFIMFAAALVFALITIALSLRLTNMSFGDKRSKFALALRLVITEKRYLLALLVEFFKAIREGTLSFFLNILLFSIVTSEFVVGINTFLTGIISIVAAWLYGRIIVPGNRVKSILVSTTTLFFVGLLLFLKLSPATVIVFSMINAFFNCFLVNPCFAITYSAFISSEESSSALSEFYVFREAAIASGRCLGIVFTMIMPKTSFGYVFAIAVLTLSQYILVYIAKSVTSIPQDKKQRSA
ncbi:MAG TPA: hypothetical protein DCP97_03885 [Ruminococcaceae bacterium]|nr:hypothetical protein [Oscillospiraceae bacterium]